MAQLPQFNGDVNAGFQNMQNTWATQLNPLLSQPQAQGFILKAVALVSGTNVINHLLSRKLQGWYLVDQTAAASIYRSAPKDAKTLTLTCSAPLTADIFVF
jgi:hypothetical protein